MQLGPALTRLLSTLPMLLGVKYDELFAGPAVPIAVSPPILPGAATTQQPPATTDSLRLLSWNLLAPPYVRSGGREGEAAGLARAKQQIAYVADSDSDVIGLQEFWSGSEPYTDLWRAYASDHGYILHVCPRVNGKADGCAMLVRDTVCASPTFSAYTYDDWGSRVLQQCDLQMPTLGGASVPLTLMNTHLTFPHESEHDPAMRFHQARKIALLVNPHPPTAATVVLGDMNAPDERDPALGVLTSLGGLTPLPPRGADGARWVSHVAHTGSLMACDQFLTRGACRVSEWRLGGSHEELISRTLPSDHRPLHATLRLGEE